MYNNISVERTQKKFWNCSEFWNEIQNWTRDVV